MRRYHGFFSGRVQGVGFRFVCRGIALRYALTGWVRNLPDGRVELCLDGDTPTIEQFLVDLRSQMAGQIRREEATVDDLEVPSPDFEIRY